MNDVLIILHQLVETWTLCFRPEMVVGWYHSHPGFGCWLSGVDINTQQVSDSLQSLVCHGCMSL